MRLLAVATALLLLASPAAAQITRQEPVKQGAVTPETIAQRLESIAARAPKVPGGVPRAAIIDFSWPQHAAEYKALGKFIIVFVSAVSREADELPLKRVYVESNGREITLEKIASVRSDVPRTSPVHDVLGPNREDAFYLAPAGVMMRKGLVLVDFAARRSGFRLYELPGTPPDFVRADRTPMPVPGAKPDANALNAMIEREYTGFALPATLKAGTR
jgi:hypothetical protein